MKKTVSNVGERSTHTHDDNDSNDDNDVNDDDGDDDDDDNDDNDIFCKSSNSTGDRSRYCSSDPTTFETRFLNFN